MCALAAVRSRDGGTRLLLAIVAVTWVGLMLKRSLKLRFFLEAFPALCLLGARGAADLVDIARQGHVAKAAKVAAGILVGVLAVSVIIWTAARVASLDFAMDVFYETDAGHAEALDWMAGRIGDDPTYLVNSFDQMSAESLDFHAATTSWPDWRGRTVTDVSLRDPQEAPEEVARFRQAVLADAPSQVMHLANTPVDSAGAWWAYQAAINACWDGTWEEATAVWVHLWDNRAAEMVLSDPLRFWRHGAQEELRSAYWYPLLVEISRAWCVADP
jgi:hypothetical protein